MPVFSNAEGLPLLREDRQIALESLRVADLEGLGPEVVHTHHDDRQVRIEGLEDPRGVPHHPQATGGPRGGQLAPRRAHGEGADLKGGLEKQQAQDEAPGNQRNAT